ncbi:MAG: hypothetical protein NTW74_11150, partial [Acidobacteria bacterium]|nr:hypothetical protein [Acidobacteriota bacterium]
MNVRFELDSFDIAAMALLGPAVRNCAQGLSGANEAAQRIVQLLDEVMKMPGSDEAALALARIYLTKTYGKLDATEAAFARNLAGCELHSDTVCLTLAGSAGRHENWCDPKKSRGHLAIPLLSVEEVLALPMVWRLFEQLGIDVEFLLSRKLVENSKLRESGLDVFHIEKAEGSRWVPGQDFVRDEAVQSCFAIGGVLPDGEVFSLLLFSKVAIDSKAATALRPLALNIEIALLPYLGFGRADEAEAKALAFGKLLTLKDSIVVRHVAALLEAREQA